MTDLASGAQTPEELETLLEDALLVHDRLALTTLFEAGAIFATDAQQWSRGSSAIAELALSLWQGDQSYVANPQQVIQAHDIALIIAERAINVVRRGSDGTWRYAIALIRLEQPSKS